MKSGGRTYQVVKACLGSVACGIIIFSAAPMKMSFRFPGEQKDINASYQMWWKYKLISCHY